MHRRFLLPLANRAGSHEHRGVRRWRRGPAWVLLSLLTFSLWAASPPDTNPGEFIRVTGEPWKVGEVRSYSITFDEAPFGREMVRLDSIRGERAQRQLQFSQTQILDLRAVGSEGSVASYSSVRYDTQRHALSYRVQRVYRKESGYSTYQKSAEGKDSNSFTLDLERSPASLLFRLGGEPQVIPVLDPAGAVLLDPLSMGHWERMFAADEWRVGEVKHRTILLPSGLFRYDFHLPARALAPPAPMKLEVIVSVEGRETVEIFSLPIPSFRCHIPELGYTLWVSGSGGILKFSDGRGLVVRLEQ
jgi:hypothetical protein